ncbi:MAG: hypothetical protein JSU72_19055 [Deltaproteobacteria bacterium]|nr:MAG: hypothetical protein JSU72_19055 [Deltaproteobacteria bacterium]
MKKVNAPFQRISVFPFVLLFSLLFLVMLASVAPANAKTFLVSIYGQGVHAWEWPDGASVEVIIYQDETKTSELCRDEQTANSDGTVNFDLSGCLDFQPGNYVEMTDGTDTKTHVVAGVALTEVDIANNTVKGTLDPALTDRRVGLQVVTTGHPWTTIYNEMYAALADPTTGVWEIDLTGQLDPPGTLIAGMYVEAMWHDADYQSTRYGWGPTMNVSWEGNFVHTWSWPPEVDVTLEVYDAPGGTRLCTDTQESLPDGQGFNFNVGCNIQPGHLVKLSESSPTFYIGAVSHIVTNLTVDCAGDVDGYVTGTAVPGSGILVQTWAGMQHVITNGAGNWIAGPFDNEFPREGLRVVNLDWLDNGTQIDRQFTDVACLSMPVQVDIKPGSDPNSINCNNQKGVIAVAILTTDVFDATTVDHTTVTFEGASETHVNKKTGEPRLHEEDVDGDGDADLVFHFRFGDTNLTCDSTAATLTGETFDGMPIEGADSINMVSKGKKAKK